ncbi:QacE family quaternary ammonium compound efflux SMR transporter [Bacillus aerolatus]|uniref:QacE family quaternary ammonium compound efflux SMR transporter n=1 Tax=Bacillus aerolatus TaxID=2653354 RepID=A0A6I1FBX4_9BACI|nr:multidrug efflux SMR transporter [Bacillus aerolatus]KAB7704755.1 QacE family quaternary ammonium compound efflux SMR transporter [Bacillus aerolatus]
MSWIFLLLAGIEEVIATIAMKYVDGTKRKWPIAIMVIGFIFSFYCLSRAMLELSAGIAYAVWTGIGTVGITIVSIIWFKEKLNKFQALSLAFIIIGVAGLRLTA